MSANQYKLEQVICYICEKHFKDLEDIVQISSRKFDINKFKFETIHVRAPVSSVAIPAASTLIVACEINFHVQCFVEIAGTNFVP